MLGSRGVGSLVVWGSKGMDAGLWDLGCIGIFKLKDFGRRRVYGCQGIGM